MGLLDIWAKNLQGGFNDFNKGFYETFLPAVDAYWIDDNIQVKVDLGGFDSKDVEVELHKNILFITADRDPIDEVMEKENKDISIILAHRPLKIRAHIPLPFESKDDKEQPKITDKHLVLVNGVLTINIVNLPNRVTCKPAS